MRHENKTTQPRTAGPVQAKGKGCKRVSGPARRPPEGTLLRFDSIVDFATVGLFLLATVFALDWGSYFVIPVTAAMIVGLTLGPVVDRLARAGIPPYLAGLLIIAGLAAAGNLMFLAFAIPLEEWSVRIPEITGRLREAMFWVRGPLERLHEISREVQNAAKGQDSGLAVSVQNQGVVNSALSSAPALFGQVLIFIGTFYFFVVGRWPVRRGILALPARQATRLKLTRVLRDTEYSLSRYLLAIAMVNTGLGVATGCAMWALGMPSPALWGAFAAVLNFVPFLGPVAMVIILGGVALVTFDAFTAALVPPLAFVGLNILESQFVTPAVVGARLVLNPLLVFLSLAFWLWLWGPMGAFLAVPILILCVVVTSHALPPERRAALAIGVR